MTYVARAPVNKPLSVPPRDAKYPVLQAQASPLLFRPLFLKEQLLSLPKLSLFVRIDNTELLSSLRHLLELGDAPMPRDVECHPGILYDLDTVISHCTALTGLERHQAVRFGTRTISEGCLVRPTGRRSGIPSANQHVLFPRCSLIDFGGRPGP